MWLRMVQLQQGFGTSEMGFKGAVAGQEFQTRNVSSGVKSAVCEVSHSIPVNPDKRTISQSARTSH